MKEKLFRFKISLEKKSQCLIPKDSKYTNINRSLMKIIKTNNAPEPIGPYSQAIEHKGTLYMSGQVAINSESGKMDNADLQTETHRVMKNMGAVLKAAGMDYSNIVKCTIFILDMNKFGEVNSVYGSYFKSTFPARETVQVSALPAGAQVEISAIAVS